MQCVNRVSFIRRFNGIFKPGGYPWIFKDFVEIHSQFLTNIRFQGDSIGPFSQTDGLHKVLLGSEKTPATMKSAGLAPCSNIKSADTNRNRNPGRIEHLGSPFHLL
jgi:hypothetical protein